MAVLSSVLTSEVAIEINISIIRTFVAMRQWITTPPPVDKNAELREEMKKLKEYMEEVFADQNDTLQDIVHCLYR